MSNHRRFAKDLIYQHTETIEGYRLHAMRYYPYAVRTGNSADKTVVEVFQIVNSVTAKAIHDLELSVGYHYAEVLIRRAQTGIYLFKNSGPEPLVESGDWVEFFGP